MNKKMSVMGVGAKIAIPILLWLAITETISWLARPAFKITDDFHSLLIIGIVLMVIGFTLNLVAAFTMLIATGKKKLAGGVYLVFRDPMYVFMIFITLPGLFLLFNSWLVLTGIIIAYISYRVFVREEHKYLEGLFGEEYKRYLEKVLIKI